MPRCRCCSEKFEQKKFLQKYCDKKECQVEERTQLALKNLAGIKKQKKKDLAVRKKELLTKGDYIKILQQLVNRFVRNRDGNYCISCDKPINGKTDAGHLFSVGNYPSVRFDLRNINSQCISCNQFNGGSILEYRENLIKKIGQEQFDELDKLAHQNRIFDIEEIKEMIEVYKKLNKNGI
jgi:hypothetical protein